MEVPNIEEYLQLTESVGLTLNQEQRIRLRLAHLTLAGQTQHDQIKFWGRLEGIQKNYYIMMGLTFRGKYEFPIKSFYWATNDFEFVELPELLLQHIKLSEKYSHLLFTGDPNRILENMEGDPAEQQPEDGGEGDGQAKKAEAVEIDQDLKKAPKKNFTELHRVSYIVKAIENDSNCVPVGSFRMTPQHQLRPHHNFRGLRIPDAINISKWVHFRAPQSAVAKEVMNEDKVIFQERFLDELLQDKPIGCWSLQLDSEQRVVSVRNLLWPGAYAFHRLQSHQFCFVYFGNGNKNADLPFML